jgi:hypothetical protein
VHGGSGFFSCVPLRDADVTRVGMLFLFEESVTDAVPHLPVASVSQFISLSPSD